MRGIDTSDRYMEVLRFQHFERFSTFIDNKDNCLNKEIKDRVLVSVVIEVV